MSIKKINSTIFLFAMLSMFFTNCSSTKKNKPMGEDEMAAKLLMDNPELSKFQTAADENEETKYIVISFVTRGMMAGLERKIDLTYNNAMKKWAGDYEVNQHPVRGNPGKTQNWDNLIPKSGWLALIKKLNENKIHSIRDSGSIEYEEKIADGELYTMNIRIGDKERKYSISNPLPYSTMYPEIKDFAYFAKIADVLEDELISNLSKN